MSWSSVSAFQTGVIIFITIANCAADAKHREVDKANEELVKVEAFRASSTLEYCIESRDDFLKLWNKCENARSK